MNPTPQKRYDVVIVGSGIAGGLIALKLGQAGKQVLVLEAGDSVPANINEEMDRFYRTSAKVPESPYTPELSKDPSTVAAGRPTVLSLSSADDWRNPSKSYLIQTGTSTLR